MHGTSLSFCFLLHCIVVINVFLDLYVRKFVLISMKILETNQRSKNEYMKYEDCIMQLVSEEYLHSVVFISPI